VEILIILGTWCSDSQEQVPKFFKILDKIKFNRKYVQMICVSRDKEAGLIETVNYNIQKVPTLLFTVKEEKSAESLKRHTLHLKKTS